MPPASGKKSESSSRRVERCQYTERGQRCRRSGTGEPPLCNPHRLVMADAGRPPPGPGAGIKNLVDRFVNGKRVTRKVWEGAIDDIARWATSQDGGVMPGPSGRFRPPAGFQPPPGWPFPFGPGNTAPPPPPDPIVEDRRRARIVLGFAPQEPITLDVVQQRRRKLARQHHPDRGGSVAKMQTVNAAADVLEAMAREQA